MLGRKKDNVMAILEKNKINKYQVLPRFPSPVVLVKELAATTKETDQADERERRELMARWSLLW